ncbi:ribosomal protein S10, putative [Eimeria necatrix]|uniref:Ribosomal protein S10, putative n=2 Tax=Eimeria TaxID=5800 RepID=U6MTL2_9EIME|nr:ribosomal protein S10, putative [Eimeria tenella]XP_013433477.1 ribosomal protein S10, putative [Eimeria necatrix]CDJ38940.1 ribosomal protein S10, putative [Eimeria tenella]CDJ65010.1 ribosomal protein S10, putative [Eimeria necatrix]|eukprot:XP_013229695.1 ribosomal protein S10, putative [Eimeria tenella]
MTVGIKPSLIPKKNRRMIYEYLFKEGVLVVQKNPKLEKHPEIAVPNLHVMMVMKSLKSKDFCEEMFNWHHNYYTLKNEGMEYLRDYLRLPPTVFPATLTKKTPARAQRAGPEADAGAEVENWRVGMNRGRRSMGERTGEARVGGDRAERAPRYA